MLIILAVEIEVLDSSIIDIIGLIGVLSIIVTLFENSNYCWDERKIIELKKIAIEDREKIKLKKKQERSD